MLIIPGDLTQTKREINLKAKPPTPHPLQKGGRTETRSKKKKVEEGEAPDSPLAVAGGGDAVEEEETTR